MAADNLRAVRVRIHGRVQGVWYRSWTVTEARRRGLRGWVRNRSDGTVEALFLGPAPAVADMIQACHAGPSAAAVRRIEEAAADPLEAGPGFEQLPTA